MEHPVTNGKDDDGWQPDFEVIIIGGGLAGLVAAIELAGAGRKVLLLEKKTYPYHKVCGEYISLEVLGYLQQLGFDPLAFGASVITKLRISTPSGKNIHAPLDMGGVGLSRYVTDFELAALARRRGAELLTGTKVTDVTRTEHGFSVQTMAGANYKAPLVIGSWGKREALDKKLNRAFIQSRTNYMGVKYHIRTDYPADEVGLDNYNGGYCGIVKIEGDRYNLCYLYDRGAGGGKYKSLKDYEAAELCRNPVLKTIFREAEFLLDAPVAINEISFTRKPLIEQGILMCGDSAGLIAPLCGNGMSIAIASARMLSGLILHSGVLDKKTISPEARSRLEDAYRQAWQRQFSRRLFWGRTIQHFFGNPLLSEVFARTLHRLPFLERRVISATHGKPLV